MAQPNHNLNKYKIGVKINLTFCILSLWDNSNMIIILYYNSWIFLFTFLITFLDNKKVKLIIKIISNHVIPAVY